MLKKFFPAILSGIFLLGIFSSSCTPQKDTRYFQTVPYNSEMQTLITKDFEHKVKVDDILLINFYSPSQQVALYNAAIDGFLVDRNGNIQVYGIGDVKVVGLTLEGVKQKLTKILMPDIFKQLAVSARFKNHRIVVLGEVGAPGVIPMETENLSLLEAISLKGDLRETARRDNVLIIRNTERGKLFFRVNLLDGSVFNSNFYYLQADDIVYVEPEKKRNNANVDRVITYALSGLSFILLVVDRFSRN